jgi:protein involved in sex pheromone biosynthesis
MQKVIDSPRIMAGVASLMGTTENNIVFRLDMVQAEAKGFFKEAEDIGDYYEGVLLYKVWEHRKLRNAIKMGLPI